MMTITNEDNMELMARYPDGYFDLAIVDPPYGINYSATFDKSFVNTKSIGTSLKGGDIKVHRNPYKHKEWDNEIPTKEYFNELMRVSKNQIIWGGNYFDLPPTKGIIVWDKNNDLPTYSDGEMAWTSFNIPLKICHYTWNGFKQGQTIGRNAPIHGNHNVKEQRTHPTQKPVLLYKWILDKYAKPNDKILDTHLGSGSIAIACHDYKFDLTACELDKEYFDKAMQRINNHMSQTKLF